MNSAAGKTLMGTEIRRLGLAQEAATLVVGASGTVSASSVQVNASLVVINTTLAAPVGFLVEGYRSGSKLNNLNAVISGSKINVTSASAGYIITAGDTFNWIAF
jgi:hypothetical protein